MRYFLTGATGFIGAHLAAKLIARGDQVTCLVRNPDKAAGLAKLGAALVKGDVSDRAAMREAMQAGVPRIVYTSTAAVFGNTHGQMSTNRPSKKCSTINWRNGRNSSLYGIIGATKSESGVKSAAPIHYPGSVFLGPRGRTQGEFSNASQVVCREPAVQHQRG